MERGLNLLGFPEKLKKQHRFFYCGDVKILSGNRRIAARLMADKSGSSGNA